MIYNNIEELREILVQELINIDSNKTIKLPYDKDLVYQLLFENNRIYKMYGIEKIDFSDIDFSGIDITGFNFKDLHGVKINPQTIANKDLSDTICNGVEFIGSFDGVRISNTNFTGSKGAVINPSGYYFNFEGCKFADVTFEGSFDDVKIAGADFTGSKGAVINLQRIAEKDATNIRFTDAIIKGSFKGVKIAGADFTNVRGIKKFFKYEKGVKINPQIVYNEDLSNTICNGVIFQGSFENVLIRGTNFTGSKGAYIYPSLIRNKDMQMTVFNGVEFLESIEFGEKIRGANFTGSIGAKIDPQEVYECDIRNTTCNGVNFCTLCNDQVSFKNVQVNGTDFTGSKGAVINPQEVFEKSFIDTKCTNVKFIGDFDAVDLSYTDFTGSIGAKIDPNVIVHRDFFGYAENYLFRTILRDAELLAIPNEDQNIESELDGCIYGVEIIKEILNNIMNKYKDSSSNIIRNKIVEELKKYNGEDKIMLPFDKEVIKLILFDGDKFATEFEEVLEKIDFKNVDFSGFDVRGVDLSKYTNITLNLETIKNKDISNSNLKGVRIIGSFDGVNKTNTILDGAYYEEQSFETNFREKIKVLTLTK